LVPIFFEKSLKLVMGANDPSKEGHDRESQEQAKLMTKPLDKIPNGAVMARRAATTTKAVMMKFLTKKKAKFRIADFLSSR